MQRSAATKKDARPSLRDIQRQDTRRKLIETARQEFRALGVESVTMEDVAAAAGVSRATIYLHFAGKALLLEALLEQDWAGQVSLFERLQNVDFNSADQLSAWLMRVALGMQVARDSFSIHRAAMGSNPELTLRHHRHRQVLAGVIISAACREPPSQEPTDYRVEAEFIAAEIEYFATAAALGWSDKEVAAGVRLLTNRLQAFAQY